MYFTTNTTLLKTVLNTLIKIQWKDVTQTHGTPLTLSFEDDTLTLSVASFDMNASYTIPIENKEKKVGKEVVLLEAFQSIIDPLTNTQCVVKREDNEIHIQTQGSKSRIIIPHFEKEQVQPNIQDPQKGEQFDISREILIEGLRGVQTSASSSTMRPELASVYMYTKNSTVYFVATDTFQLSEMRFSVEAKKEIEVLIPQKTAHSLVKLFENLISDNVVITKTNYGVYCESEGCVVYARTTQGNFFDYKAALPKTYNVEIVLLKSDVTNFFKKARLFADGVHRVSIVIEDKKTVQFVFKNDHMGETKDILIAREITGDGSPRSYNYKYIQSALQTIKDDFVMFRFVIGGGGSMCITGVSNTNYLSIIAPLIETDELK